MACSGGSSAKTQVHQVAKDISGHGNDLPLVRPPRRHDLTVDKVNLLALSCALFTHDMSLEDQSSTGASDSDSVVGART